MPKRLFRPVMANPFWVLSESIVPFHQSRLKSSNSTSIVVEFAKESRPRRENYDDRGNG